MQFIAFCDYCVQELNRSENRKNIKSVAEKHSIETGHLVTFGIVFSKFIIIVEKIKLRMTRLELLDEHGIGGKTVHQPIWDDGDDPSWHNVVKAIEERD